MTKKIPRVILIDALNMYFRAYIVDPSLSTNGDPIGGVKGFLKILQKLCRELKPDRVIVCWDGPGGSRRRKSLQGDYKSGRKPIRLNRSIRNMTEREELKNKVWQQTRLFEYLNEMPIVQILIPDIEADDIIAVAKKQKALDGWQKIIISNDKDFIQLCDDETIVYRPTQKEVLNVPAVVRKYGIHPKNFTLARALAGDKSDNLPGVGGVGLKTVAKRLPFLSESRDYTTDEVINFCETAESDLKVFSNVVQKKELFQQNYKLMQLYSPNISPQNRSIVRESIEGGGCFINKTAIRKMMVEDGFGEGNWTDLFQILNRIAFDMSSNTNGPE